MQSTLDGKDYVTRELTVAPPGGTTGWHYHPPGQVFGVIKQGTLTHYRGRLLGRRCLQRRRRDQRGQR